MGVIKVRIKVGMGKVMGEVLMRYLSVHIYESSHCIRPSPHRPVAHRDLDIEILLIRTAW